MAGFARISFVYGKGMRPYACTVCFKSLAEVPLTIMADGEPHCLCSNDCAKKAVFEVARREP